MISTEKARILLGIRETLDSQMTAFGSLDLDEDTGHTLDLFQLLIDDIESRRKEFSGGTPPS